MLAQQQIHQTIDDDIVVDDDDEMKNQLDAGLADDDDDDDHDIDDLRLIHQEHQRRDFHCVLGRGAHFLILIQTYDGLSQCLLLVQLLLLLLLYVRW